MSAKPEHEIPDWPPQGSATRCGGWYIPARIDRPIICGEGQPMGESPKARAGHEWGAQVTQKERAIQALKFVKVETKKGYLTDISIATILVELERRGIKLDHQQPREVQ